MDDKDANILLREKVESLEGVVNELREQLKELRSTIETERAAREHDKAQIAELKRQVEHLTGNAKPAGEEGRTPKVGGYNTLHIPPAPKPKATFVVKVLNLNGEPILDRAEIGPTEQVRKLMYMVADALGGHHRVHFFLPGDHELQAETYIEDAGLENGSVVTAVRKPVAVEN
eukprot:gnl/MRDRNA2_/MRDRNA2_83277_c0_seq2.p1 gnl/MRDRNA2_/MRDRNA2_83277_c0~~gnl/MRDRNA2_/MRDRNA2_83277_c0_seq2.p1  ORF type:complete len:173 (+),score=47.66 gnl/MRDRNA2_/MRDRNA2_83277_c0_seq2:75-593(+)